MTVQIFKKMVMGLAVVISFLSVTSAVQAWIPPGPKAENPYAAFENNEAINGIQGAWAAQLQSN